MTHEDVRKKMSHDVPRQLHTALDNLSHATGEAKWLLLTRGLLGVLTPETMPPGEYARAVARYGTPVSHTPTTRNSDNSV